VKTTLPVPPTSPSAAALTYRRGDLIITYMLIYSRRRTIGIHIYSDGRVIVRAPLTCTHRQVEAALDKRQGWLRQHLNRIAAAGISPPPSCETGAPFALLGRTYRLAMIPAPRDRVCCDDDSLYVEARDPARVEHLIAAWYKTQADRIFAERLAVCFERVRHWGVDYPDLRTRTMKTRWGSCSASGRITLNTRLVTQPIDLIDYVILHELCHLRRMDHSPAFYALMDEVAPDWRQHRARLRRVVV